MPAILHGCIPVMTGGTKGTPIAAPIEEHPDVFWPDFSVEVLIDDLEELNRYLQHLERIPGRLDRMQHALGHVWPRFLWNTIYNHTYLGEDGSTDGFRTVMDILLMRTCVSPPPPLPFVRSTDVPLLAASSRQIPCVMCLP